MLGAMNKQKWCKNARTKEFFTLKHYQVWLSCEFLINTEYTMVGHYVRPKWNLLGQTPVLVGKCPMPNHYFKHWYTTSNTHTIHIVQVHTNSQSLGGMVFVRQLDSLKSWYTTSSPSPVSPLSNRLHYNVICNRKI